jgi:two-component system, chemotaxis family, chemotaxis protein CheY
MKSLIVEDDFTSRLLLQTILSRYGECHVAVNGREAVDAFSAARASGRGYDLVCMDIMMPEMDGHAALEAIRNAEMEEATRFEPAARVVMTTALDNVKNVAAAFRGLCDAYLVKPINSSELIEQLREFSLVA